MGLVISVLSADSLLVGLLDASDDIGEGVVTNVLTVPVVSSLLSLDASLTVVV